MQFSGLTAAGVVLYLLVLTCSSQPVTQPTSDWVNSYDGPVHFECPAGKCFTRMRMIMNKIRRIYAGEKSENLSMAIFFCVLIYSLTPQTLLQ